VFLLVRMDRVHLPQGEWVVWVPGTGCTASSLAVVVAAILAKAAYRWERRASNIIASAAVGLAAGVSSLLCLFPDGALPEHLMVSLHAIAIAALLVGILAFAAARVMYGPGDDGHPAHPALSDPTLARPESDTIYRRLQ
jgi:hypothetical protein